MHDKSTDSSERRRQTRYAVQCHVVAIATGRNDGFVQPVSIKARAEDVSFGGARLLTKAPFGSSRLWLRFADTDGLNKDLIECRIVRAAAVDLKRANATAGFYEYGLRFRNQLTSEQLARLVAIATVEESA